MPRPVPCPPTARTPGYSGQRSSAIRLGEDDGMVYLIISSGERMIDRGRLANGRRVRPFRRRSDDLATEVTPMETRLAGTGDARRSASPRPRYRVTVHSRFWRRRTRYLAGRDRRSRRGGGSCRSRPTERSIMVQTARSEALPRRRMTRRQRHPVEVGGRPDAHDPRVEWRTITDWTVRLTTPGGMAARDAFNRRRGAHFRRVDRERAERAGGHGANSASGPRRCRSRETGPPPPTPSATC